MARKRAPHPVKPAARPPVSSAAADSPASVWREHRREITFLVLFLVLLGGGFALISLNWVNDHAVEPFTAGIARASGVGLNLLGQQVSLQGTIIQSSRFAVNIRNGCNGVEAMLIFLAAVLAFPASWRARLLGLGLGTIVILFAVLLWILWANRFTAPALPPPPGEAGGETGRVGHPLKRP